MPEITALVTISHEKGRDTIESETPVRSLEDLYEACRRAPTGRLVRVVVSGPQGSVRLDFANFTPRA